ncbi:MAG: hypothetical protein LBQ62_10790, partial [Candidatus Accumulibacter sp.]|nr:hypothetical protein [Accumulibacter sp.]
QDKYVDLKRIRQHIQKMSGELSDISDAYIGEELYHGRAATRSRKFLEEELRPLLTRMNMSKIGTEEFEHYLHARHAPEANAEMARRNPSQKEIDAHIEEAEGKVRELEKRRGHAEATGAATASLDKALQKERAELSKWKKAQAFDGTEEERHALSGMSNAEARKFMDGLTSEKRARLEKLAAMVDAIQEKTLVTLESYGLMSRQELDEWRATYKYYIPLHRDEAHPDSVSHPIGSGFSVRGQESKARTGSNEKVTHILGHIAMQREAAITRGEKNRVAKMLYLMARQNPNEEIWKVGVRFTHPDLCALAFLALGTMMGGRMVSVGRRTEHAGQQESGGVFFKRLLKSNSRLPSCLAPRPRARRGGQATPGLSRAPVRTPNEAFPSRHPARAA